MVVCEVEVASKAGMDRSWSSGGGGNWVVDALRQLSHSPVDVELSRSGKVVVTVQKLSRQASAGSGARREFEIGFLKLWRAFMEGDDAAFDELRALTRIVASEERTYPPAMRGHYSKQLEGFDQAGSAQALRERQQKKLHLVKRATQRPLRK